VCIISILFNFVLHLSYGFESFLYSPDWAYALIFFVGLSLGPLAKNRILQAGMLVFLVLLAYNQVQFFQFVLATIAPFYGRGG
jgi:putative flippase GtrA